MPDAAVTLDPSSGVLKAPRLAGALQVSCCPLGVICQRFCAPDSARRASPPLQRWGQEPTSSSKQGCSASWAPGKGVLHFGEAGVTLGDLSLHLPPPNVDACLAGLPAFESAVTDLLEQPAGKELCDAYGGKRYCLLRFLQARDADVQKASEMIRAAAKYRYDNHINNLRAMPPHDVRSQIIHRMRPNWPGYCVGMTQDGSPVLYCNIAKITSDMFEFHEEALRLLYIGWMERSLQLQTVGLLQVQGDGGRSGCGSAGQDAPQNLLPQNIEVYDCKGESALSIARKTFMLVRAATMLKIGVAAYPEHMRKCFMVNTPAVFSLFTNLVLKTLPPATRRKIECSRDRNSGALRAFMEPEQIEAMFEFSISAGQDHKTAVAEVRDMMSGWKGKSGIMNFGDLRSTAVTKSKTA